MKKTLIIVITAVIIFGILIYFIYSNSHLLNKKSQNDQKSVSTLIQEQEKENQSEYLKLKKISEETDFDPKKSTPKEVSEKLDIFIKEMEE